MKITIPKGFRIGHAQDEHTGVTAIICEKGCVAGVDVRGGAPGTRETDLLKSEKAAQQIHAVVLTGGSAFGLDSASGVMQYLKENGRGFKVGKKRVPIVCGAVIYDLIYDDYYYPDKAMGYEACVNSQKGELKFGQVGVGKGATVGKIRGVKYASKSGVGAATVKVAGITLTAIVAVNALGDVVDPDTRKVIAGCKAKHGFAETEKKILNGEFFKLFFGNTTIGAILTDAKIDKVTANKIASVAHNGLARTIYPVHTDYDGDTLFCMAKGNKPVINTALLEIGAVKAVELAVINAVKDSADYEFEYDDEEFADDAE